MADANVIFSALGRGLLLELQRVGLIDWVSSPMLLREASTALEKTGRVVGRPAARHQEALWRALVAVEVPRACLQRQYQRAWRCAPGASDLHVAACALSLSLSLPQADTRPLLLLTHNLRDFRAAVLAREGVTLQHPDAGFTALLQRCPEAFAAAWQALQQSTEPALAGRAAADRLRAARLPKLLAALQVQGLLPDGH